MPIDRQLDETISRWLEAETPVQLPDRVLRTTFERTRKTRQQGGWRAVLGRDLMNRTFFALGGAAAVVVVAVVASGLYFNQTGIGVPPPTPTPRPSPVALPGNGVHVEPGWHFAVVDGYRYTFHVPAAGWQMFGSDGLLQGDASNDPPDFAGLGLWGDPTYANQRACRGGAVLELGGTADEMASVLAGLEGFRSSEPTDVTVGRYTGKRLQLTVPRDEFAECPPNSYRSYSGRYYQAPEQVDDIWILDLEDGDRALFSITYLPSTPTEIVDELRQMVESLEIEPVER